MAALELCEGSYVTLFHILVLKFKMSTADNTKPAFQISELLSTRSS